MWFVHHLPTEVQERVMEKLVLPKLPIADHTLKGTRDSADHVGKFYDEKVTCQACHVGGIENLGLPEVKPETEKAKQRRCYTNYEELFGVKCGPCDGVAGVYDGDNDDHFTPTECIVVGKPEE